ncbi:DUF805 domain-containing protein [Streptomyces lunaelactis]|uniref:DUF805 domain-containing protein n=1 Tax=Streptomyces lunaelactis TaxID=1535768 RepID=UPI001584AF56|nr:DUF805 domain-containing protein [Streptomyces lunaelactis]NUK01020.1 DUF805 domain-containing protein [Streptomyces lunaelactis]NUK07654.1 DUF805 domain-containing protein [Streptomyces lunaelactis]NUK16903.1 DUF805 domain-containing protein [Streptomyces lunaelactis]NUK24280.1 DUF805 domain-containing protein [Streptomyces lunaelactis]NUK35933.1 DUF805 domain-containing protein [Streptomyces lunaelactis]
MNWYVDVLKKYAVFSGRARRQEYWMFFLFNVGISIVLAILDAVLGTSILQLIYAVAVFLPSLGVAVRRLHDTDRSGWWLLIGLVPLVGFIILIVFLASEGKAHENAHGPNPKAVPAY